MVVFNSIAILSFTFVLYEFQNRAFFIFIRQRGDDAGSGVWTPIAFAGTGFNPEPTTTRAPPTTALPTLGFDISFYA